MSNLARHAHPMWKASLAIAVTCLTACTTLRPIEDISRASIERQLEVGDSITVVTTNAQTLILEVSAVDQDAVRGITASGKRFKVPYSAIRSLEVERTSFWKTAAAVVGGVVLTVSLVLTSLPD